MVPSAGRVALPRDRRMEGRHPGGDTNWESRHLGGDNSATLAASRTDPLPEQILRDLESRMDRATGLVRPQVASLARKLKVSVSSLKRTVTGLRNSGFIELCHVKKRPTDKVSTILYRILNPVLPSHVTPCGS